MTVRGLPFFGAPNTGPRVPSLSLASSALSGLPHLHHTAQEVNVLTAQARELASTQAGVRSRVDEQAIVLRHSLGQGRALGRR